jgi:hypothetical protein
MSDMITENLKLDFTFEDGGKTPIKVVTEKSLKFHTCTLPSFMK